MNQSETDKSSTRQRVLRYGPVLVWTGLILFASTQGFSAGNTSRIVRPLLLWLFPNIEEAQIAMVHFLTRKAAHFIEYAILALLARRAFISSSRNFLRGHWFALSLPIVILVACIDELNQSFVPSRTGSFYDSCIDIAGGLTVLLSFRFSSSKASDRPLRHQS
jgi:VanZ family protein